MRERGVRRANVLACAAALLVAVTAGMEAWAYFRAARDAGFWVRHTYQVLGTAKDLEIALDEAEDEQRKLLLSGEDPGLRAYADRVKRIRLLQARLQDLTSDNLAQGRRLHELAPLVNRKLAELARAIKNRSESGTEVAARLWNADRERQLGPEIDPILADFTTEEQGLLTKRLGEADRLSRYGFWLAISGSAIVVGLLTVISVLLTAASRQRLASQAAYRDLAGQLATLLDSIGHGVGVIDAAGRLVRWNDCLPAVLDLPRAMVRAGTPYAALADYLAATRMGGAPFLEGPNQVSQPDSDRRPVVYERTCPDGRSFEMRRDPMRDGGFVLNVTEVTDRLHAEAALRETQRMQAIGQLSGGIAHDFNNLLSVILGNLELALARLEPEHPVRSRLERAIWGAKRGASLSHQLLAFAREQPLTPRPSDLAATLKEMEDLLRRTLGEQIELTLVIGPDIWPAMADAAQVQSAILNLALNARDAMPQGGRLTVELANVVMEGADAQADIAPGDYVMIAVSDTGMGMPPEVAARAFEPFFTTKGTGEGTGLGLAMVSGFAKRSGGHARVESAPGKGTTVRVFLPRADGRLATEEGAGAPAGTTARGTARVLVVEDDPAVGDVLAAILTDLGYQVVTASNGATALKLLEANAGSVDLALVDLVLPAGMAGRELARRIAEAHSKIRTIFISGYSEGAVGDQTLDERTVLIGKPFEREQLARLVAQALGTVRPA